jgi:Spy/CpxP family protein refolding chaperone
MNKRPMKRMALGFALAAALAAFTAAPTAAVAPASPGACNMFHVRSKGMEGMMKASGRGLGNMMALVIASEESGCTI